MPQPAVEQLYAIMHDPAVSMGVRITSAISASHVEPLNTPEPTPAVAFLQYVMEFRHAGKPFKAEWRRKAGAALAYYERRAKRAELQYDISDQDEQQAVWRNILNALLRQHLWPNHKHKLFQPDEPFNPPPHNPELATIAIMIPAIRQTRRRTKAIDQPEQPAIQSENQRRQILRDAAEIIQKRLIKRL